ERVRETERDVPAGVVLPVPVRAGARGPGAEPLDLRERGGEVVGAARDADVRAHHVLQGLLHGVGVLTAAALERRQQVSGDRLDGRGLDARLRLRLRERRRAAAPPAAE